jgi:endoribonuclease LACTB2
MRSSRLVQPPAIVSPTTRGSTCNRVTEQGSANRTWRSEVVAPDVVRVSLPRTSSFVNVYLIGRQDDWTLVDAAEDVPVCREALFDFLARQEPAPRIRQIFLTHGHRDHVGLAEELADRFDATIVAHPDTLRSSSADLGFLQRHGLEIDAAARSGAVRPQIRATRIRTVGDRDMLAAGRYHFRLMWTPGHHPGHLCAFDQTSGLLISGDRILGVPTPLVRYSERPSDPISEHLRSADSLRRVGARLVLPGHGRAFADLCAALDRDRRFHLDAADSALNAISASGTDAMTLADLTTPGGPDLVSRLARTLATLGLLEERELVSADLTTDPVRFHRVSGDLTVPRTTAATQCGESPL